MPKGKPYSAEFKARPVPEAPQGAKTVGEIAAEHGLNPNLVGNRKAEAEPDLSCVFSAAEDERARERELAEHREEVDGLHRKIGELAAERDYLQRGLLKRYGIDIEDVPGRPGKRWGPGREAAPAAGDPQVELLLQAQEAPARPGGRRARARHARGRRGALGDALRRRTGGEVDLSRRCVAGLMEEMNVRPACPKPSLSKPAKRALRHPYLLKNKPIRFPNQVRGIDIAYIPIGRTHMYLTCVIDWYSRLAVAWRLADDMGAAGACACMEAAFAEHGMPSILNSDQGSVLGSAAYEGLLASNHVLQSMDGRARWADSVIVERWGRSLKSECVRICEYGTPAELRGLVAGYVEQYNGARPHQSLGYDTPSEWYYSGLAAA